jgi:hypothetical protein
LRPVAFIALAVSTIALRISASVIFADLPVPRWE